MHAPLSTYYAAASRASGFRLIERGYTREKFKRTLERCTKLCSVGNVEHRGYIKAEILHARPTKAKLPLQSFHNHHSKTGPKHITQTMASSQPQGRSQGELQGERIQANCRIIWGNDDYDLDISTDDWEWYSCSVQKDFGTELGPPLTMTGLCNSSEKAWAELDRMLDVWARQVQSGKPMTEEQQLEIFGGERGENRGILKKWFAEKERMGL